MDLNDLLPVVGKLNIKLPNGQDTGIVFDVVGEDSAEYRKGAKVVAQMFYTEERPSPDAHEKANNELFAGCVVGWTGLEQAGKPIPYTAEKALELLSNPKLTYIRQQVEEFVQKRTEFFRPSTKQS